MEYVGFRKGEKELSHSTLNFSYLRFSSSIVMDESVSPRTDMLKSQYFRVKFGKRVVQA